MLVEDREIVLGLRLPNYVKTIRVVEEEFSIKKRAESELELFLLFLLESKGPYSKDFKAEEIPKKRVIISPSEVKRIGFHELVGQLKLYSNENVRLESILTVREIYSKLTKSS